MTAKELQDLARLQGAFEAHAGFNSTQFTEIKQMIKDQNTKVEGYQSSMMAAFSTQDNRIGKSEKAISNFKIYVSIAVFIISSITTYIIFKLTGK